MKPLIPVDTATAKLFENMSIVLYETCVLLSFEWSS